MKAEYTIKDTKNPTPWIVVPATMMRRARAGSNFALKMPAWGPIMSKGYAGKIQIGVIWAMVNVCVDQLGTG